MDPIATRRDAPPIISLNTHNVLDYVIGVALIFSPYIFGFAEVNAAKNLFLVLGFGLIGYSLITNYRYSVAKVIPLGVHMTFDVAAGVILMLGPSLFSYKPLLSGFQYALHFIFGLGAVGLVALTKPRTNQAMKVGGGTSPDVDIRRAA